MLHLHQLNKERSAAWTSERLQVYFSALVLSTRQAWNEGQREELHDVSSGACQAFCQGHRAFRRGISAAKKKTAEVTSDYTGAMLCSVHHAPRYVAPHPSLRLGTPPKMPCDCDRLCLGMQDLFSRKTLQRVQQPKLRRRPGPVVTRPLVWEALEMSFLQRGWQGEAKASVLHGQGRFLRSLQFICALCHETGKADHDHVFLLSAGRCGEVRVCPNSRICARCCCEGKRRTRDSCDLVFVPFSMPGRRVCQQARWRKEQRHEFTAAEAIEGQGCWACWRPCYEQHAWQPRVVPFHGNPQTPTEASRPRSQQFSWVDALSMLGHVQLGSAYFGIQFLAPR